MARLLRTNLKILFYTVIVNMSIFNISDQGIPESFLIKQGFKKIHWGSPLENAETSVAWEKIDDSDFYVCTFWYFPPTFNGYVHCRAANARWAEGTRNMKNHIISQLQRGYWDGSHHDKLDKATDIGHIMKVLQDFEDWKDE